MNTIKTLVNGLKHWVVNRKIDEKQIPESIARVEDIKLETVNGVGPDESGNVELAKPNLNQNDPEASDYVEGRTHWVERECAVQSIKDKITITASQSNQPEGYGYRYANSSILNLSTLKLNEGNYRVIFDGVTYELNAIVNYPLVYLGNLYLFNISAPDTGEPFCMYANLNTDNKIDYFYASLNMEHTIEVYELRDNYQPLEDDYIPDTIARKNYIIQSNQEQSNPTSLDFIKNRTHYHDWETQSKIDCVLMPNGLSSVVNLPPVGYLSNRKWRLHDGFRIEIKANNALQYALTDGGSQPTFTNENLIVTITGWQPPKNDRKTGLRVYEFKFEPVEEPTNVTIEYKYPKELKQLDEKFIPDTIARTAEVVKTVNGIAPDENNNVTIDVPEGADGATFIPDVSTDGILSWTNNKELENPVSVNIKGPKGDIGDSFTYDDFTPEQLAALKGDPGKTPVKGTDYFTESDKAEMVNAVLAALPTWTGGSY
jgi:hypothetical protein